MGSGDWEMGIGRDCRNKFSYSKDAAICKRPAVDCRLWTADSRLLTADSRLLTNDYPFSLNIGMPQHHGRDGPVGSPGFGNFQHLLFGNIRREFFDKLKTIHKGNITEGKKIGSLKGMHKVHINGPVANTFQLDQLGSHFFIRQGFELFQNQFPGLNRPGQFAGIAHFLPGKINGSHFRIGQCQYFSRGHITNFLPQFFKCGISGCEGNLLFEYGQYKGLKSGGAGPHGRITIFQDYPFQVTVFTGQLIAEELKITGMKLLHYFFLKDSMALRVKSLNTRRPLIAALSTSS